MSDAGSEILTWFRLRGFIAVFFSVSRISVLYSDFLEMSRLGCASHVV